MLNDAGSEAAGSASPLVTQSEADPVLSNEISDAAPHSKPGGIESSGAEDQQGEQLGNTGPVKQEESVKVGFEGTLSGMVAALQEIQQRGDQMLAAISSQKQQLRQLRSQVNPTLLYTTVYCAVYRWPGPSGG